MPAPSAAWIMSMLNPYAGFKPDSGHALGFAQLGEQRKKNAQEHLIDLAKDARANKFMDFQHEQWQTGQQNDLRDRQMKAFTAFQAAVDSGDTEQATLAANALRLTGVDVEEYGAGEAGTGGRMPSSLDMAAKESPSAAVAQAQAQASSKKQAELKALDKRGNEAVAATKGEAAPQPEDAQVAEALDYYEKNPPVDEEDAAFREEYKRYIGRQRMERASAEARAMKTPTAWAEQTDYDPQTGKGSGMNWRAVGGDAEGNPIGEEPFPPADVSAQPVRTTGLPEAAPEPTAAAPQARGYRLNFGGKVIDISPDSVLGRQRERVKGALLPILNSAQTPEEKSAARAALDFGIQSVGLMKPEEATLRAIGLYNDELDREAKTKRARIVGGKGGAGATEGYGGVEGLTKESSKRSLEVGRFAEQIVNKTTAEHNVKGVREEIANADDAIQKANSKNPLSQFASKATLQKMLMKGALSDRDVARLEAAPGQWTRLEQWVNNWTEGGKVPDDVLRQIRDIANKKRALLKQRLHEAGTTAKQRVMGNETLRNNMTPEELEGYGDEAYGAATGVFRKKGKKPKKGTASADEVRKALGK